MHEARFQSLLTRFFLEFLPITRGLSPNTIASYRDAFLLLLRWFEGECGVAADEITFQHLTARRVEAFLNDLGSRCSPSTCNSRLAALKAFCRFAQRECPEAAEPCSGVLSIKAKKCPEPVVGYLSADGVAALLESAASSSARDLALLSTLYDLGIRVQEVCDLKVRDLSLGGKATATVTGKGGKTRLVPMAPQVASIVCNYLGSCELGGESPLFPSCDGGPLGRSGVAYILSKHASLAHASHPQIVPQRVTPHMLRHSKAMHLLESGVNLIYIRDFLGHSSITTTEVYAKANPEAKRDAVEKAAGLVVYGSAYGEEERRGLVDWLKSSV